MGVKVPSRNIPFSQYIIKKNTFSNRFTHYFVDFCRHRHTQVLETKQKPGVKCFSLDSKHASPNALWALLHLQVGFLSFVILLLSPSQKSPPGECYSLRLSIGSKGSGSSLENVQVKFRQFFSIPMT